MSVSGKQQDRITDQPFVVDYATDEFGAVLSGKFPLTNVHNPEHCSGRHCPIHNPSNHHMQNWPTCWRLDLGVLERMCPHGVGHPDPDSRGDKIHGCDGCCQPKERK